MGLVAIIYAQGTALSVPRKTGKRPAFSPEGIPSVTAHHSNGSFLFLLLYFPVPKHEANHAHLRIHLRRLRRTFRKNRDQQAAGNRLPKVRQQESGASIVGIRIRNARLIETLQRFFRWWRQLLRRRLRLQLMDRGILYFDIPDHGRIGFYFFALKNKKPLQRSSSSAVDLGIADPLLFPNSGSSSHHSGHDCSGDIGVGPAAINPFRR
jgi:hypothetical protein